MLDLPINKAIRTTSAHLKRLDEMGIQTVKDFLLYFPMRYTDESELSQISEIKIDEVNIVRGTIKSLNSRPSFRGRMSIINAVISDSSGSIEVVWFNQPYLSRILHPGVDVILSGKAKFNPKKGTLSLNSPKVELIKPEQIHTARIVPVYHETDLADSKRPGRISSKWIREKLFPLMSATKELEEYLPEQLIKENNLSSITEAIYNIHFPASERELERAKNRLAFDELFLLQLAALHRKYHWRKISSKDGKSIKADWDLVKEFTSKLPWPLTNAQKKSVYEIIKDMEKPYPMSRLLEGDTGSGKTVVAAIAALHAVKAHYQVCLLAPTEILARQHAKTFMKLLEPFNVEPVFLFGSTPEKEKSEIRARLRTGQIPLIIGTHALIQETIEFKNLGLAIIDEQHRFGVKQRESLKSQGSPHMLSLTATPIPRTLALVLYGDQDLSVLDEMPEGRQKIVTRIIPEEKRKEAYEWIGSEIKKGRQAFIIFPLIQESEVLEVKAATQEWEHLKNDIFPEFKVGLLHGQMQTKDKALTMEQFSKGHIDILVSTAVVEVGVDVPNATIMMIEGAERFGLAQLHQFRGRVGRGSEQSYCFLLPSYIKSEASSGATSRSSRAIASIPPEVYKRLHALVEYDSGFKLAEVDLQLRGPGEVYGTAQSGIPDLKMANLGDSDAIKKSRDAAEQIINEDPELKEYPKLLKKIVEQENIAIDY